MKLDFDRLFGPSLSPNPALLVETRQTEEGFQDVLVPKEPEIIEQALDKVQQFFKDYQRINDDILVGDIASEHVRITPDAVQINIGETTYTSLEAGSLDLGLTTAEHIVIDDTNGIRFYDDDGTTLRAQLTGSIWTLGNTTTEHVNITSTQVQLKDGATVLTNLEGGIITLGSTSTEHVNITSTQVQIKDGASVLTNLEGGTLTLGATSTEHVSISSTSAQMKNGATVLADLTDSVLTLGTSTAEHITISATAISIYADDGSTVIGSIDGDVWTVGQVAVGKPNIIIDGTAGTVDLNINATTYLALGGSNVVIGDVSSNHTVIGSASLTMVAGGISGDPTFYSLGSVQGTGEGLKQSLMPYPEYVSNAPDVEIVVRDVTTTGATGVTIHSYTTSTGAAYFAKAFVVGRRTGGSAGAANDYSAYEVVAIASNKAGTLATDYFNTPHSYEDNTNTACTWTVSGTTLLLQVSGDTNNNYSWSCYSIIEEITS